VTSTRLVEPPRVRGPPAPGGGRAQERRSIGGMAAFVLLLHLVGWGRAGLAVAPPTTSSAAPGVLGVGVGLTAYMLGVRHAFDADHIASIDNTTRKLVGEGSLGQHRLLVLPRALLRRLRRQPAAGRGACARSPGVVQDENSPVAQTSRWSGRWSPGPSCF
jgi:hypothetical protein